MTDDEAYTQALLASAAAARTSAMPAEVALYMPELRAAWPAADLIDLARLAEVQADIARESELLEREDFQPPGTTNPRAARVAGLIRLQEALIRQLHRH